MKKYIFNLLTIIFVIAAVGTLGGIEHGFFGWLRAFAQAGTFVYLAYICAQAERKERRRERARRVWASKVRAGR